MPISKNDLTRIKNEIQMAEKLNEEELKPCIREGIARYTGQYVPDIGTDWDVILNNVYPIVQFNLPSIFFRNPKAYLKPRRKTFIKKERDPVTGKMVQVQADSTKSAKTQEHIINYDLEEIRYKDEVRKTLLDSLIFPFGVLWHGYKGNFGMTEENSYYIKDEKIFVKRVSPLRFIKDPCVTMSNLEEGRWVGRIIDVPYQDLVEDDKLKVDKNLKGFKGFGELIGTGTQLNHLSGGGDSMSIPIKKPLLDFSDPEYHKSDLCRFVRVYEIFLRPTKKQKREGKKGTILLLTDEQDKPLRESDWTIKAEGFPAKILEFNPVPDQVFGMADIDSYKYIGDQRNAIVNLQLRNAQENSKIWVGISKESANEEDIDMVRQGHQTIVKFEEGNPRDRMFVSSGGGTASNELYLLDQRIKRDMEEASGVSDLKKGFVHSGEESATSVRIRTAGGAARPAYRQDIMADFLKDSVQYLLQLEKQFLTIKDAVRIMGSLDVEWSENPTKEDIQADVDVEIDVISMLPEDPQRELQEYQTILAMVLEAVRDPVVRQKIEQEGKTVTLTPLIEQILMRMKIRNPEVFRNIRPEEEMGFVSVQQLRQAQENISAILQGQPIPFPPNPEDDHMAKLEVYTSINNILQMAGIPVPALQELIAAHQAMLQEIQSKQDKEGQVIQAEQVPV